MKKPLSEEVKKAIINTVAAEWVGSQWYHYAFDPASFHQFLSSKVCSLSPSIKKYLLEEADYETLIYIRSQIDKRILHYRALETSIV